MDSTASRLLKARQYAEERDRRLKVHNFELELHGDNSNHTVRYNSGNWNCDCEEFILRNVCAHVMAIEEFLGESVEPAVMYHPSL